MALYSDAPDVVDNRSADKVIGDVMTLPVALKVLEDMRCSLEQLSGPIPKYIVWDFLKNIIGSGTSPFQALEAAFKYLGYNVKLVPALQEKEYLHHKGHKCPICGADGIVYETDAKPESNGVDTVRMEASCITCKHTFREVYNLVAWEFLDGS